MKLMLFVVASGGIPTRVRDVMLVRIFFGTGLDFHFSEVIPGMRLGPHGKVNGLCGLVMGCHTHNLE
jgi:hypothetical protein